MTQRQIILNVLKQSGDYIPAYQLEKSNTQWGWLGTSCSRRCRELQNEGLIERKIIGKYVNYRIKRADPIQSRMPLVTSFIL